MTGGPRVAPAGARDAGRKLLVPVRHRRARRRLARRRARGRRRRRRRHRGRHPVLRPGDGRPDDPGGVASGRSHAGATPAVDPRRAARRRRRRPARGDDLLQPRRSGTGHERFAPQLVEAGVDGAILPDLPLEELGAVGSRGRRRAASRPCCSPARPRPTTACTRICERSQGFVYGVGLMGVTGERASLAEQSATLARRLKAVTDKPVLLGFGVSTPEQAVEVAGTGRRRDRGVGPRAPRCSTAPRPRRWAASWRACAPPSTPDLTARVLGTLMAPSAPNRPQKFAFPESGSGPIRRSRS